MIKSEHKNTNASDFGHATEDMQLSAHAHGHFLEACKAPDKMYLCLWYFANWNAERVERKIWNGPIWTCTSGGKWQCNFDNGQQRYVQVWIVAHLRIGFRFRVQKGQNCEQQAQKVCFPGVIFHIYNLKVASENLIYFQRRRVEIKTTCLKTSLRLHLDAVLVGIQKV